MIYSFLRGTGRGKTRHDKDASKDSVIMRDELGKGYLLRALIDSLPDYLYVKDTESRYVLDNRGHIKALGTSSPEEVAGKSDFDFYPEELAEQYHADEQEIVRSDQPLVNKEESSMDEEGNRRWHSTTRCPYETVAGRS